MIFDQEVNAKSYSYSISFNKRSVVCFTALATQQLHKSHPVVMYFFPNEECSVNFVTFVLLSSLIAETSAFFLVISIVGLLVSFLFSASLFLFILNFIS